ncbi:MAG: DoxX family protein [Candidatus Acidiferrales bacterium]
MNSSHNVTVLSGRILLSAILLLSGVNKIFAFKMYTGWAAGAHLPLPPVAIAVAAAIEILGGLAIITGFQTKLAAWVVFLYLIPTTFLFHNFWTMDGMNRIDNQVHFLKNVAIMGGLLILAANGAGGASIDAARASKR